MRALVTFGVGGLAMLALCTVPAILGRALDWSPYALVVLGALLGVCFGFALTLLLYLTGPEDVE
jgi:hypothetical protein